MRGKGRNNWLKVQPHHPAWVLLFRDTMALSRLMGVEVHQHQKCAFSWLRFKHKLQDAPCQPRFTLTNCESKDWSQEGGMQALLLGREQVRTEFLTHCVYPLKEGDGLRALTPKTSSLQGNHLAGELKRYQFSNCREKFFIVLGRQQIH